jgi:hypothetical protein
VESEVGQGSRFTVRIPLIYGEQGDIHAAATLVPDLPRSEPAVPSKMVADHA